MKSRAPSRVENRHLLLATVALSAVAAVAGVSALVLERGRRGAMAERLQQLEAAVESLHEQLELHEASCPESEPMLESVRPREAVGRLTGDSDEAR